MLHASTECFPNVFASPDEKKKDGGSKESIGEDVWKRIASAENDFPFFWKRMRGVYKNCEGFRGGSV